MAWFYLYVFGSAAVGLLLALVIAIATRRRRAAEVASARVTAALASAIVLAAYLTFIRWSAWPWFTPVWLADDSTATRLLRVVVPLVLGIVLILAVMAAPRVAPVGVAGLTRRGLLTFASRRGVAAVIVLFAAAVLIAVLAGLASTTDDEGRYSFITIEVGAAAAGTSFYGWYFSLPAMIAAGVLALSLAVGLTLLPRRPLGAEPDLERARRESRGTNMLLAAGGAVSLHLASVLSFLGASAALVGSFESGGDLGTISVGTPFAALGPTFSASSHIIGAAGYAAWFLILIPAVIAPRSARASA